VKKKSIVQFRPQPRSGGSKKTKELAKVKPQNGTLGLDVVHSHAAGIDVGNSEHWVAVPPRLDAEPVRRFGCYTADLKALGEWLKRIGITTVAMQSTGVYWVPLADILAEQGIQVFLVNARDTKNLPGRKTDIQECQWLLQLHVYGLLRHSFRPAEEILRMRTYWRQRQQHVADAARCIQHMQKALTQMNLQLANAISDISGVTGQQIIAAILQGQRDPHQLAKFREPGVKASEKEIAQSLQGNWREELLFVLKQEYETYQTFQKKIGECDKKLKMHYQTMEAKGDPKQMGPQERGKRPRGNVPQCMDLRTELYRATGVDLTAIDSINVLTAQTVISEIGIHVKAFPTEAQFVSFLNLAPRNKISGGKVIGKEKRKKGQRAGLALQQAATSLLKSDSYLGAQYRRLRTKLGAPSAKKAMANKLARIIYRMLNYGEAYVDKGNEFYEQRYRQIQLHMLERKAAQFNLKLVEN
jgi:transposase